jgi:hypothetical protein
MDCEPTNSEIALELGIDEAEVEKYRGDTFLLGDGSWLIHFAYEMPKELRHRLTKGYTLIYTKPLESTGAGQND